MKKYFFLFFKLTILSLLINSFWIQQMLEAADLYGRIRVRSRSSGWTSSYPKAEVELRDRRRNIAIQRSISDNQGRYYMFNIPPGRYNIVVDGQPRLTVNIPSDSEQQLRVDDIIIKF